MRKHNNKRKNRFKVKAQLKQTKEVMPNITQEDFAAYIRRAEKEVLPMIKETEARASVSIFLLGKYTQTLLATNQHFPRRSISNIINSICDLWRAGVYLPGPEYPFTLEETLLDIAHVRRTRRDYAEHFQEFRPVSPSPIVGLGQMAGGILLHPKTHLWQIWIIVDDRHVFLGAYRDSDEAQKALEEVINSIRINKNIDSALSDYQNSVSQIDGEPQQISFEMMEYLVENLQKYTFPL